MPYFKCDTKAILYFIKLGTKFIIIIIIYTYLIIKDFQVQYFIIKKKNHNYSSLLLCLCICVIEYRSTYYNILLYIMGKIRNWTKLNNAQSTQAKIKKKIWKQ